MKRWERNKPGEKKRRRRMIWEAREAGKREENTNSESWPLKFRQRQFVHWIESKHCCSRKNKMVRWFIKNTN